MSVTVTAWETEDASIVVWGTHDPKTAAVAFDTYLVDELGFTTTDEDYLLSHFDGDEDDLGSVHLRWGRGDLMLVEGEWPARLVSREWVLGWVPYMVIVR